MPTTSVQIRNFTLLGHIDHGKSTLADRFLQMTGVVPKREMQPQFLDKLASERKRGVTIKLQTVRMQYQGCVFNLIDTPGHVDFSYEVSRSLAACEGAVLLVDAVCGIQAQTLSNFAKAQSACLKIIPVVNKIDLPRARPQEVALQICQTLGFKLGEVLFTSAKTGQGVAAVLSAIKERIPPPPGKSQAVLRALVFDSFYHEHQGVVALVRVFDGCLAKESELFLINRQKLFQPAAIGIITSKQEPTPALSAGEVGFIATGIKDVKKVRVGDTITEFKNQKSGLKSEKVEPLSGYQEPKPMVFANLFPADQAKFRGFRLALEKLALNDAALTLAPVSSLALGFGFRVGFLGRFHLEITKERLEKEFQQEVVITRPTVDYRGQSEPWVKAVIYTRKQYLGATLKLCQTQRGLVRNMVYFKRSEIPACQGEGEAIQTSGCVLTGGLASLIRVDCELPLSELMGDFYHQLKSVSAGFASMEYQFLEYRPADLVKVSILVNQQAIEELSLTLVREKAETAGRGLVEKLKKLIPRQQFSIPIQAAVNGRIIARANVSALRKDVTAKLYGGDRTRKDKLLKKQARGKKRLKKFGRVEIPKEAFLQVLKNN